MRYKFSILILSSFLFFSCDNKIDKKDEIATKASEDALSKPENKIFEKVPGSVSNIKFSNNIKEDLSGIANLFDFDYFYNGAGVGIGDFNNDGLPDVFFCGNQVENKLYLNKGDLKFEDISNSAGINVGKVWSNAVTIVDINQDGWQDIYISQGGPNQRLQRKNLLFINNKDNTFTEKAADYGLADMGISTHAVFFDYDKDGDLDCLVMNENELYGVDPYNLYNLAARDEESKYFNSSHLYRNDNGKFKNVTKEAGLERPIFGLGLGVSDINNDGWLDIYIASDYYIPDALFINNMDGTFSDKIKEYTSQISFYGMGLDIADINNDGLQDIFVLDMAARDHVRSKTLMASMDTKRFSYLTDTLDFHHQYMYNSFQLNQGNNNFSNIAQLSNTANTDWSWSVLMYDFDLNERRDIFITNGYRRYALDNDLQQRVLEAKRKYGRNVPLGVKSQLYQSMPSEKLRNILYKNKGNLEFEDIATQWGLTDYSFSNGAAVADLDNDGDLDILVNNIDQEAFLYKNLSSDRNLGNFLKVKIEGQDSQFFPKISLFYDGKNQFIELKNIRGYRSSQQNIAHFGIGKYEKIDSIKIKWIDGTENIHHNIEANQTIAFAKTETLKQELTEKKTPVLFQEIPSESLNISYQHRENHYDDFETEVLLPYKQSTFGPYISKADINNDGKTDFYIGGAAGQPGELYVQDGEKFRKIIVEDFLKDSIYEDMESVFFDFDGDGDQDLFVVSGGNEFESGDPRYIDRLYINNGNEQFTRHESNALNSNPYSGKSITVLDMDKDGDNDIIIGNRIIPQAYPRFSPSVVYENVNGELKDVTKEKAPDLQDFGIVNSIVTTDFNNDGWEDIIVVGEWTGIGFFENKNGKFQLLSNENLSEQKGWWYSIAETDINNDGLKDYILGNVGLNIKFKASLKKPLKIFANDFDGNGTNDIVLGKQYFNEYVPVRGKECSSQQMPFLNDKFSTYSDFANANLKDIFGDSLEDSYKAEATQFNSILLINKGNNEFDIRILPIEAQMFPVFETIFIDLNNDGFEDAVLAGNIYETEVETPRLDAISGQVLLSNGKDGYDPTTYEESGLYLKGNIKDIELIQLNDKKLIITGSNNGTLKTYLIN
ncbi:VCBS repeat-containing protein [Salegentibacter sp. JZCK2]|uniref:VCBS repeat-containing protein n=1 Tax=Salegentibacter tibetensis TaxID=2873600 RepID=UPI001CCE2417|nr:VCBS repeat-containing protein [Salegentibacter tibetensis]MBZ9728465.1 VCBS repeat-containing protein [Salegentibacter tibetensis]